MSTAEISVTLSDSDRLELEACESIIEKGLTTFVEVGNALVAIRDRRLYRADHATFEAYCEARFGLKRTRAYQLIDAAKVVNSLSTIVDKPANEAQARPLVKLAEPDRAAAWDEALATAPEGKPTAKHVEAIVDRKLGREPKPKASPERRPSTIVEPPRVREPGEDEDEEHGAPPAGVTRLNGVLVADPPEIAAARASGKIGPKVIPEVTTNDEPDTTEEAEEDEGEGEGAVPEADQSDADWLAALPLHAKLTGVPLRSFDSQALLYRWMQGPRATFAYHAARAFTKAGREAKSGPYGFKINQTLRIDHPRHWVICPAEKDGGCAGAGTIGQFGDCPKCFGRGYLIF